jgi:hypothetical protein
LKLPSAAKTAIGITPQRMTASIFFIPQPPGLMANTLPWISVSEFRVLLSIRPAATLHLARLGSHSELFG